MNEWLVNQAEVGFAGGYSVGGAPAEIAIVLDGRIELGEIGALVVATGDRRWTAVTNRDVIRATVTVHCSVAKLVAVAEGAWMENT